MNSLKVGLPMLALVISSLSYGESRSRFPATYKVSSPLSDGSKVVSLARLEELIGQILAGSLDESGSQDIPQLVEVIVHRDMTARSRDPGTESGIYKLFENQTRLKDIMAAFHKANEEDNLVVREPIPAFKKLYKDTMDLIRKPIEADRFALSAKSIPAVEKFYIDYLWLEALKSSGLPLTQKIYDEAATNAAQHFLVAYYFLAQKDRFKRPESLTPAPKNAIKALYEIASQSSTAPSQRELIEQIIQSAEQGPTRSSLSNDYTRPFSHIAFGEYRSAALKVWDDVYQDPFIVLHTLEASHGGWAYHPQIKRVAEDAIRECERTFGQKEEPGAIDQQDSKEDSGVVDQQDSKDKAGDRA